MSKTKAPPKPFISGFCNPTLPRTAAYDPHQKCSGCTCQASGCPCNPDAVGPPAADPQAVLADVSLDQVVDMLAAVAEHADTAAMGAGVTSLGWEDAVRLLDRLRGAGDHLRVVEAALITHVYVTGEHGKAEVAGIGQVEIHRSRDRKDWDERGVARAVIDQRMEQLADGEFPDPWDVAEWLLEVYGVQYCRVTALRALGLEPKAFCTDVPGKPSVTLPPRRRL